MAEYIERVVSNADSCCNSNKIKTHFAQIIVRGKAEKPYYEILYFGTEDRTYHIGFGSYCLDYVFKWLSNEFEIVEAGQEDDVASVRHGRWEARAIPISDPDGDWIALEYYCSLCNRLEYRKENYCPNCGAKMDLEG